MTRPPLDVTAKARTLLRGHRLAAQNGVDGAPQVHARYRDVVALPAAIHLAAVHQAAALVEQEEIWRACGPIRLGDLLRFVEAEGEAESQFLRHLLQALW